MSEDDFIGAEYGDEDFDDDPAQEPLGGPRLTEEEQVAQEDLNNRDHNRHLRAIADRVAAAMAKVPGVERIVLFGSVARPPVMTAPYQRRLRSYGDVTRRCDDVDLAVWVSDLPALGALQRARNKTPGEYLRETDYGIANHQIDVFIMEPGTNRYLGRLCVFSKCPNEKTECMVPDCGKVKHLQQHSDFTLEPDALAPDKSSVLFDRTPATGVPRSKSEGSAQAMRDRPNVLLICTDHWGEMYTRPAGHPVVMTPTLDQLCRSGVRYTRAYSACPSCIPARKSLTTGMTARKHGDRVYTDGVQWPQVPTLAQCFRDAGYQAYCVGKLHVWPQRDRLGFDDVLLEEQGRHQHRAIPDGVADDWELFLQDQGFAGQEYAGGMTQNDFVARPWHLPEYTHPINWAAREMCRTIRRRDPRRPGFWYLSFSAPHPPLWPLREYLDMYAHADIDMPVIGEWARRFEDLPLHMQERTYPTGLHTALAHEVRLARQAYYATLTHIDHQIRVVIGYLREAGLLDNTIIVFTSDHGHMLGDHNMWAMTPFYEPSAHIPLFIVPTRGDQRLRPGTEDDRLAEFGDLMPTLLDLAGIRIPDHVNQLSMLGQKRRNYLYGEHGEGYAAQRMILRGKCKLIYAAAGGIVQLFDLEADPRETEDLARDPAFADEVQELLELLASESYGNDSEWVKDGRVVGLPHRDFVPGDIRHLQGQRGLRFL